MSTPEDLKDIYTDELKDLWSANDQMKRLLKKVTAKASDAGLKEMLTSSQAGIEKHTDVLKELIVGQDEKLSKEHCKGMEGLVTEATKHILEEGPEKGPLLDTIIIAQYQRMTHYGIGVRHRRRLCQGVEPEGRQQEAPRRHQGDLRR